MKSCKYTYDLNIHLFNSYIFKISPFYLVVYFSFLNFAFNAYCPSKILFFSCVRVCVKFVGFYKIYFDKDYTVNIRKCFTNKCNILFRFSFFIISFDKSNENKINLLIVFV